MNSLQKKKNATDREFTQDLFEYSILGMLAFDISTIILDIKHTPLIPFSIIEGDL